MRTAHPVNPYPAPSHGLLEYGWVVPARSVENLVVAMRSALHTPTDVLEEMGLEGARPLRQRHDVTTGAGELAPLLRSHVRTAR